MTSPSPPSSDSFGALLKRHRGAAGLSQEALAERAGLGVRTISDLERGVARWPQPASVALLVGALGLDADPAARAGLEAAARRPVADGRAHDRSRWPDAVPARAPALHLPAAPTPFIGREPEVAALTHLLRQPAVRLLTLTGPGGTGKTRLALRAAQEVAAHFADGVFFVGLAAVTDANLVAAAIAEALGVEEPASQALSVRLGEYLSAKQLLLVLDNAEHLLDAGELVGRLLATAPHLTVLTTSRAPFRLAAEREYPVPALRLPDLEPLPALETVARCESVRLFVERAQAIRPAFRLDATNARAVAEICHRLDGLPLAIELAAARVRLFDPPALLARLSGRLALLTGGARDLPPRQRTLRATIDWSYRLLEEPEQWLFGRLAVFVGGWRLEAAEAVCAEARGPEVLDGLAALAEQSLLRREEDADGTARFGMLETIREYAWARLAGSGEAAMLQRRHASYYLGLAQEGGRELQGPRQADWADRLEREHDNLRAALDWAREHGESALGLQLAGALWPFWERRGHLGEGRAWLQAALAGADTTPGALRATALNGAGVLAFRQGDYGQAAALHEQALALRRALGDTLGIVASLSNLGLVAYRQGDYRRAAPLLEEALALRRPLGDTRGIASTLDNLGLVASKQGEYGRAAALHEESLALARTLGHTQGIAYALGNLGNVAYRRGDHERAATLLAESLALNRELGDKSGIAATLIGLGHVTFRQGAYGRTEALLQEALLISRDVGARDLVAEGLEVLAWVATARGQVARAGRLGGAAKALREAIGAPLPAGDWTLHDRMVRALLQELGADSFSASWAAGCALPLDAALAEALKGPHPPQTQTRTD